MVVYVCAECQEALSRPVVSLSDASLLRDGDGNLRETPAGEPDYVPEGFVFSNPTESTLVPPSASWPLFCPEDLEPTTLDTTSSVGCCGPSEMEKLNTDCPNGHKVGIEHGDCYTVHCIALDPERVERSSDHETVAPEIETVRPEEWLRVAAQGTRSDRRRAIVLLGIHERTEAIPLLEEILTTDPDALTSSVIRALGRIGTQSAVEPLGDLLFASEGNLRKEVARALGQIDHWAAVEELLSALEREEEPGVCDELRGALMGRASTDRLVQCFENATSDAAENVALELVAADGYEQSWNFLFDVITDPAQPIERRELGIQQISLLELTRKERSHRLLDLLESLDDPNLQQRCLDELQLDAGMLLTNVRPDISDRLYSLHERGAIDQSLDDAVHELHDSLRTDDRDSPSSPG